MKPVPVVPNGPAPAGVDYDMWLGPAPKREFNANRFHFNFRWFWDYAGGLMTDWGVHEIDIALYAMGVSAPKSVTFPAGNLPIRMTRLKLLIRYRLCMNTKDSICCGNMPPVSMVATTAPRKE